MASVKDIENSSIFCPNCGKLVKECKTKYIVGDVFNYKKVYIKCPNCVNRTIIRVKK